MSAKSQFAQACVKQVVTVLKALHKNPAILDCKIAHSKFFSDATFFN